MYLALLLVIGLPYGVDLIFHFCVARPSSNKSLHIIKLLRSARFEAAGIMEDEARVARKHRRVIDVVQATLTRMVSLSGTLKDKTYLTRRSQNILFVDLRVQMENQVGRHPDEFSTFFPRAL